MSQLIQIFAGLFLTTFQLYSCTACHIPANASWQEVMRLYYAPSSSDYEGYVTDAGSYGVALHSLRWYSLQVIEEYQHSGYVLIGGGYGFVTIEGKDYLIQNRGSEGYTLIQQHNPHILNANQARLYKLGELSQQDFEESVRSEYDGIISTKSPNDIGRVYCLYHNDEFIGKFIVGDHAGVNDWTPYGKSLNDYYGHARLGLRVGKRNGMEYYWIADLTREVYQKVKLDEGLAIIRLLETSNDSCNLPNSKFPYNTYKIHVN